MTAIIGTYGRTLIFLGLSVPWHSKPAADSPPSHPFLLPSLSLSLIVPLVFSIPIPLFLSSSLFLRPSAWMCTVRTLPVEPPPCDGTRPLLIINISRTRSAGKSPARPILCGLWRWGVVIEIETFEHTQCRVPRPRHTQGTAVFTRRRARAHSRPSVRRLFALRALSTKWILASK